jgi:hypothetical protein
MVVEGRKLIVRLQTLSERIDSLAGTAGEGLVTAAPCHASTCCSRSSPSTSRQLSDLLDEIDSSPQMLLPRARPAASRGPARPASASPRDGSPERQPESCPSHAAKALSRSLMLICVFALGGCSVPCRLRQPGSQCMISAPLAAATLAPLGIPLRNVEVVPAPWLASNVMALPADAYAQSTRRQAFKLTSRWAAQPGQLLELVLKRAMKRRRSDDPGQRLPAAHRAGRVHPAFLHSTTRASRGVIEARCYVARPAQRAARRSRSCGPLSSIMRRRTADAAGGVAALRAGTLAAEERYP